MSLCVKISKMIGVNVHYHIRQLYWIVVVFAHWSGLIDFLSDWWWGTAITAASVYVTVEWRIYTQSTLRSGVLLLCCSSSTFRYHNIFSLTSCHSSVVFYSARNWRRINVSFDFFYCCCCRSSSCTTAGCICGCFLFGCLLRWAYWILGTVEFPSSGGESSSAM